MHLRELTPLLRIYGVHGAIWVDGSGTTLLESGYVPELLAPHVVQLVKVWEDNTRGSEGGWREVHASGWKLLIRSGESGYLMLLTDEEANLGQIRVATQTVMLHLDESAKSPFGGMKTGGEER